MKVMESMIERVAKALCRQAAYGIGDEDWPVYAGAARAAIEEMRDPPEDIICCGDDEILAYLNDKRMVTGVRTPAHDSWNAMIDASLKEEGEEA